MHFPLRFSQDLNGYSDRINKSFVNGCESQQNPFSCLLKILTVERRWNLDLRCRTCTLSSYLRLLPHVDYFLIMLCCHQQVNMEYTINFSSLLWRRAINSTALNFLKFVCQQYDFFCLSCQSVWAAITEYPRLGGLNDKRLLLTVPRSSRSKYGDSVSDESPFPGPQTVTSLSPHLVEVGRKLSGVSYEDTDPMHEGPTLMTQSPLNGPLPNTVTLRNSFQHGNIRGDTNSQSIALFFTQLLRKYHGDASLQFLTVANQCLQTSLVTQW